MTGGLRREARAPFPIPRVLPTPNPQLREHNRVRLCACTAIGHIERGRGGDRRPPPSATDGQEIVGGLPQQPKPGQNCPNSAISSSISFFYFYSIISKKKKYKSTEVGKVAENQQVKAVLFWTLRECRFVRTVQEYGPRKECGKSTAVKALMHNGVDGQNRGFRTFVQLFSKVSAHP